MGKPLSIESQRVKRIAAVIERDLRAGMARELRVGATDVGDPDLWRRAAVIAAHRIGFRASTFAVGGALVLVVHRPVSDAEKRVALGRVGQGAAGHHDGVASDCESAGVEVDIAPLQAA